MIQSVFILGTPALTTRGLVEKDIIQVAQYLDQAIRLAAEINKSKDGKDPTSITLKEFKENMKQNSFVKQSETLKQTIESFAAKYPMPGYENI